MMPPLTRKIIQSRVSGPLKLALANRHRQLILLSGSECACISLARHLITLNSLNTKALWMGEGSPDDIDTITHSLVGTVLGNEFSCAVINAFSGFECDSVAALEGTIVAGGALILLTPTLADWHALQDPAQLRVAAYCEDSVPKASSASALHSTFNARFARLLCQSCVILAEDDNCAMQVLRSPDFSASITDVGVTDDRREQNCVIDQLSNHHTQHTLHTLLLIADRGRGKSAALGIAAGKILQDPNTRIIVSAPGKRSASILFRHLQTQLSTSTQPSAENRCQFCPPDQLSALPGQQDILIVDEAASIPLPVLLDAATRFTHALFASTVKGYEGAGRGFALRFSKLLDNKGLKHKQLTLEQPIRWSKNDPLELFFNSALMLDSPLNPLTVTTSLPRACKPTIQEIKSDDLAHNEKLLRVFYGLLLQAHYKTTPNDLRHILDSQNLRNFAFLLDGEIVGAATIASEGPIADLRLRQAILSKQRRPIGHLLPQLLAQYTCSAGALDLRIARVVRIAIHPHCQRQGLGSEFLQALSMRLNQHHPGEQQYDAIGAMFSAVPETVKFWSKNAFVACHLGARKQTSSGYRSITMLVAGSKAAQRVGSLAHALYSDTRRFHSDYAQHTDANSIAAQHFDEFLLTRYIRHERSFADTHAALARIAPLVLMRLHECRPVKHPDCALFLKLQSPIASIKQLQKPDQSRSKKELENRLRSILYWYFYPDSALHDSFEPTDPE